MKTVLIADDEKNIRASLETTFRLEGFRVVTAADGAEAVRAARETAVDLALLDLQMPKLDGIETLTKLREATPGLPVILLTAHGSIETAVRAVRAGAFDFIEKPPHSERILLAARNALRQAELETENRALREEVAERFRMIGASPVMRALFDRIERVGPTRARVLILGENGTGKELIARALHRTSPRAARPFVRVNCAAIPAELFESELFGHEKGAFTGSTSARRGRFRRADGGTLFLDEVAEIPLELQAKLLRAIEAGEVEPVGSDSEVPVDVRLLAATNRNLEEAVAAGTFRQDLYYRLQVVTLTAPPLRDRREDIPLLVQRFVEQACEENHVRRRFTDAAVEALTRHDYPGNVRELRNVIERLVILSPDEEVTATSVPDALGEGATGTPLTTPGNAGLKEEVAAFERRLIIETLERHRWHMTAAAAALGLERSHLYKKLKALGVERPE